MVYDDEVTIPAEAYTQAIFEATKGLDVTLLCEPGRYMVANAGAFFTKVLYEKVGFFDIMEQMVFFDERGRARVWMHPNVSASRPFFLQKFHKQEISGSQSDMIVTIIHMIEEHDDP